MTFIRTTPQAVAAGETRAMYQRQQAHFGYLPNYATVFCHRPALMRRWADLQKGIRRHVAPRTYELATLAAALALKSSYCALAHATALTDHFSHDELLTIIAAAAGPVSEAAAAGSMTAAEVAMMRYAARVAADASAVEAADVEALRSHGYTDAEIFDIAATAAARAFFSKVVEGLGARPDAAYADLPTALREALTVGRAIEQGVARQVRSAG